jgi:hypothetical protein
LLTGLNLATGGTITSSDSILTAFGKVQNQINGLVGGVIYKGTWNASTNTPTLTSSVGTQGWYYIVTTAGSTNLNGITDWQLGDWVIFNGSVWQKVDNTDAVVSVNGYTGAVVLTTSDISEGTNLYFTNSRAINSTLTGFVSATGTITSSDTVLTSIEKLYGNMNALVTGVSSFNTRTGAITLTSTDVTGALGYTPYNATNPSNYISLLALSATTPLNYNNTTGVFTITQSDATHNGYLSSTDWSTFNSKQDFITAGTYLQYYRGDKTWQTLNTTVVPEGTNLYFTTSRAQNAITLTTTGNSGSATYVTGTLNVPTYTISGLGGVPSSRTLTIAGVTYDLSADRTWSITSSQWTTDSNGIFYNSGNVAIGYTAADATYKFKTSGTSYFDDSVGIGVGVGSGGSSTKQLYIAGSDTGKLRLKGGVYELSLYQESGSIGYLQYATGSDFYITNSSGWTQIYHPDRTASIYGGLVIGYYGSPSNAALDVRGDGYFQTDLTVGSLIGTGTRMVVTNASGKLSSASIPSGTVTSVGLTMPSAFTVSSSPVTTSGTIAVTGAGTTAQYVRGDGSLANYNPGSGGGGSSQVFYFNGSVSSGVSGYEQMSIVANTGASADFSISANGYIASFLTDSGSPNQLLIPAGNWNFECYFSSSSSGGTPYFYLELYKYNGSTFTLISSSSSNPEGITNGTVTDLYITALTIPSGVTLSLTDRLAVRIYVNVSGRTITLHTQDSNLSEVITTFSTGITALNGLTTQVQNFAIGTSGSDFNISSVTATHTFNLPTASASVRGALSTTDWTTFNSKQNALSGTGFVKISGTTISYDNSTYYLASNPNSYIPLTALSAGTGISYNNTTGVITNTAPDQTVTLTSGTGISISGTYPSFTIASTITQYTDALARAAISLTTTGTSGAATYNSTTGVLNIPQYTDTYVGTVTSVAMTVPTGLSISGSPITSSGTLALSLTSGYVIPTTTEESNWNTAYTNRITSLTTTGSSGAATLSSNTLNIPNYTLSGLGGIGGSGTTNYVPKFTAGTTLGNSIIYDDGTNIGIGTTSPLSKLQIVGTSTPNNTVFVTTQTFTILSSGTLLRMGHGATIGNTYAVIDNLTNGGTGVGNIVINQGGGNVLINTTTDSGTGHALQVNGGGLFGSTVNISAASGDFGLKLIGIGGTNSNYGLRIDAGTSSLDYPIYVRNKANSTDLFAINGVGDATFAGAIVGNQGIYMPTTKAIQFDAGVTNDYNIYKSGTTLSFNTGGSYLFNGGNTRFASNYAEVYQPAVNSASFRFSNPTNSIQGYVGYAGSGTDMVQLYNYSGGIEFMTAGGGSSATKTTMDSNGRWGFGVSPNASFKALFDGDIKADTLNTIQGGMTNGMGAWKLGKVVNNTVSLDTTRFVEVEIDGVVIRLAVIN